MKTELETKRLYKQAHTLLKRANQILDEIIAKCETKEQKLKKAA